jgi:hypothetical protein|nr:MAG TPA: hypothetical protein [Bacteriophage sp.]
MITFNELRITPDGKRLIIDASVKDMSYYQNVYIDKVVVDSQGTYVDNRPSRHPVYTTTVTGNSKRVQLVLDDLVEVTVEDNMFFVYVITKGTPSADTPEGMNNQTTIGVAVDLSKVYNTSMCSIRQIECSCEIPKNFIESILRIKALELAIRTAHYTQAIKYWKKFFMCNTEEGESLKCRCNGTTG